MHDHDTALDVVGCPQCGGPAEVVDRFDLESTDGPVAHVRLMCVQRHWMIVPVERLPAPAAPPARPGPRPTVTRATPPA